MLYVVAVLAAFITSLSPFGGMIFTLAYGGKYRENMGKFFLIFFAVGLGLLGGGILDIISFCDLIFGIGIAVFAYFIILRKTENYFFAIISAYGFNLVLAVLKQLLGGKLIRENVSFVIDNYRQLVATSMQNNPEQLNFALQLLETTREIFTTYYISVWSLSIISGLYLGTLIVSKNSILKWQHRLIRLPYESVYFLLVALLLFLIPSGRVLGINALLILAPLFLIEGISVLDFYLGDFLKKTKILLFLLIVSMVFNYFILSLIALLGLLDIWFDFRKIENMEDIDEVDSG